VRSYAAPARASDACALALAREGAHVTISARHAEELEAAAREITAETGTAVTAVAADLTTTSGRETLLAACLDPDILVNNSGGEPPGDFRQLTRGDWLQALDEHLIAPLELIKATLDGMIARRYGRVVNITSSSVKAPLPFLDLTNGTRSGFTGVVAGLARDAAPYGVTINNLLPGAFDTDRLHTVLQVVAQRAGTTFEEQVAIRKQKIPARRLGTAAEFGAICAFVCSVHAGYITGQNLLVDGGAYPGTL
jgi:3-oxoacyl-[acyl-carrier protein] reductase